MPTETSRRLVRSRSAASRSPAKTLARSSLARRATRRRAGCRRATAAAHAARAAGCRRAARSSPTRARAPRAARSQTRATTPRAARPRGSSSATKASRYTRDPRVTSAAAARIHRGEKPNAAIEPSSTAFPTPFLTARRPGSGSNSASVGIGGLDAADQLDRRPAAGSWRSPRTAATAGRPAAARALNVSWTTPPSRAATRADGTLGQREQEGAERHGR